MSRRTLSANVYLAIFISIGLLMFAAISANLYFNVNEIKGYIKDEMHEAANAEMQRALSAVERETQRISNDLSLWDEVHQQLADPTYYVYWRELRLKKTERFPSYLAGSELYDKTGKALVALPYSALPTHIPQQNIYLAAEDGKLFLYQFSAIKSRVNQDNIAGYSGVKIDFIAAIRALSRFAHIDANTIGLNRSTPFVAPPEQAASLLTYATVSNPTSSRLGDVATSSLRDYFLLFAGMMLIFSVLTTTIFTQPLHRLNRYIGELRRGSRNYASVSHGPFPAVSEIDALQKSLQAYQAELDTAQNRLDRQNIELWQLAHIDNLTGVSNRLAFDEDWRNITAMARNKRIGISLVLFDCDFFKAINDTYGHEVGDRVIQTLAETLQEVLRKGDKLYRLGGDEFVTILANTGRDEAHTVALRCNEAVNAYAFSRLGIKETIKLSVGIAHAEGTDFANLSELPRQADIAMYHAKRSTREKIIHYTPSLDQDAAALVSTHVVNAVLSAIETGAGLEMHYQPVLRADTQEIEYYEALARIRDRTGVITPSDIFPIITRRNLEIEFDRAVLKRVHQDLNDGVIPGDLGISINVSGSFLGISDFCQHFNNLAPHLSKRQIIVELTETSFITHLQHAAECLRQLRQNGFCVALDDFGSGYSSIRYLANMPVDIVKFDISMVHDLNKDLKTRNIIKHTADLILEAGYSLVAEGIDSEEVLQRVRSLGATHLQGYMFGRPQRPPQLTPAER